MKNIDSHPNFNVFTPLAANKEESTDEYSRKRTAPEIDFEQMVANVNQ